VQVDQQTNEVHVHLTFLDHVSKISIFLLHQEVAGSTPHCSHVTTLESGQVIHKQMSRLRIKVILRAWNQNQNQNVNV